MYSPETLGAAIRHFRREAGLTQAELAERTGLHRSYLSELEQGHHARQVERILAVLKAVGVRLSAQRAEW